MRGKSTTPFTYVSLSLSVFLSLSFSLQVHRSQSHEPQCRIRLQNAGVGPRQHFWCESVALKIYFGSRCCIEPELPAAIVMIEISGVHVFSLEA